MFHMTELQLQYLQKNLKSYAVATSSVKISVSILV